jgi:hypothetical protein
VIALHDRRVPGTKGNIDHLVVGPAGVYTVDAKRYEGKVERRDVGSFFRSYERLYVNNRDRTKVVKGMSCSSKLCAARWTPQVRQTSPFAASSASWTPSGRCSSPSRSSCTA